MAFDVAGFRDHLGLTQIELASALHVHVRTIRRWETGDARPSPMALHALKALKTRRASSQTDEPASDGPQRRSGRHAISSGYFLPSSR